MATKNTLTMGYVLKQVKNVKSPVKDRWFAHVDRWFAHVDRQGTLSTRGLAQHMIEHGLVGNRAEVESILTKLSECIPELVGQGYGVKLDGIGIFYPSIANKKGGADSVQDFTVTKNIEGVRFRFRPDSTNLKVSFGNGYYQEEAGKKAPKIPLAAAEEPEP